MDPNIQEIVARFKQLDTNSSRHAVIHRIIDELSSGEWRDIKERINERTFQKDILGALPLEVAVQIAQYLSLAELHLLRRVSKRWHEVTTSKVVCGLLYRQYTGTTLSCPGTDFTSTFTRYSKHRTRLERGDPRDPTQLIPPSMTDEEIHTLDYSDGRYAWMTDNSTTIVVHNLMTGVKQRFCTKNRERLDKIRLSQSTVAAITVHGYCHVWSTLTEEVYSIRLPNTDVSYFVLSGFRVAVSFERHRTNNTDDGFIMLYHLQSRCSHIIPHVQARALAFIALNSANHLTTISLEPLKICEPDAEGFHQLRVTNYQLHDGDAAVERSYTMGVPLPLDWTVFVSRDLQASCRNRLGILRARSAPQGEAVGLILPVSYDPQTNSICVHTLQEHQVSSPPCMVSVDKDVLYYVANDNGKQIIRISNPSARTTHHASKNMELGLPRDPSDRVFLFDHGHRVLIGDSRFVSMIDSTSTRVWSF